MYLFIKIRKSPIDNTFQCYTDQRASELLNVTFYQNALHMSLVNDIIQAK